MTETSPVASVAAAARRPRAPPTRTTQFDYIAMQGMPLPLVELRAPRRRRQISRGTARRWASSRSAARGSRRGYYDTPEQADRWTDDGWFRTGDIVSIHPRGFIQIKDRSKDVIKSGGEWISSVELENALMAHPASPRRP